MDLDALMRLAADAGNSQRASGGQITLGHLRYLLATMPPDTPCRFDTGHHFGLAFPSSYRGYYQDCCFNASTDYEQSNVGHVLGLVEGAIGKSFQGYKGGVFAFDTGTLVWGGSASHSDTSDRMVSGAEIVDGVCIIQIVEEPEFQL